MTSLLPLAGVKVLEIAHYIAGPAAGMALADLGAEVVKVEPPGGEPARRSEPLLDGESLYFATFNRGKRSVCLDLRTAAGREQLAELVRECDVLLTNYLPGVPERLGFGYKTVRGINSRAVMVHVTGFGSWSRIQSFTAFDSIIQAMSGLADMVGEPDGMPYLSTLRLADHITAQQATTAALAALRLRDLNEEGTFVEVSMLRALVPLLGELVAAATGLGVRPTRTGNRRSHYFVNVFPTRDGALVVSPLTAKQWAGFCEVIGAPEWGSADVIESKRHVLDPEVRAELERATRAWAEGRGSMDAATALQGAGVPSGPVWSVADLIEADARFGLRLFDVGSLSDGTEVTVPASPFEWGTPPPRAPKRARALGDG